MRKKFKLLDKSNQIAWAWLDLTWKLKYWKCLIWLDLKLKIFGLDLVWKSYNWKSLAWWGLKFKYLKNIWAWNFDFQKSLTWLGLDKIQFDPSLYRIHENLESYSNFGLLRNSSLFAPSNTILKILSFHSLIRFYFFLLKMIPSSIYFFCFVIFLVSFLLFLIFLGTFLNFFIFFFIFKTLLFLWELSTNQRGFPNPESLNFFLFFWIFKTFAF